MRVILTGANRGLGLELARQLSARGARIDALVRNPIGAVELAHLSNVFLHVCNMSSAQEVEALGTALAAAPVDLLINNAGLKPEQSLPALNPSRFEDAFRVNALAPLFLSRALAPGLRAAKGKVLHVSTQLASITNASGGNYAYRMSKAALNMGIRVLAQEHASDGIVHVLVHPGWVKTDMGGASAPITPAESARGMLSVMDRAGVAETGRFFDYEGHELPW